MEKICTLQFGVKVQFIPILNKKSDQSPDYKIYVASLNGESIEIGGPRSRKAKNREC
jgi:uncharacterized protein (DUF736 family)